MNKSELYEAILKTSPDPIIVYDLEGKVIEISCSAVEIFGLRSADEVIGKSAFVFVEPAKSGQKINVIIATALVKYDHSTAIFGIMTDITDPEKELSGNFRRRSRSWSFSMKSRLAGRSV